MTMTALRPNSRAVTSTWHSSVVALPIAAQYPGLAVKPLLADFTAPLDLPPTDGPRWPPSSTPRAWN